MDIGRTGFVDDAPLARTNQTLVWVYVGIVMLVLTQFHCIRERPGNTTASEWPKKSAECWSQQ